MALSNIQIVSTRNAASPVTGWRQDLAVGDVVALQLNDTTGVSSFRWEILGRPEGSSAGGAGPEPILLSTGATAGFTVDDDSGIIRDGTYIVRCTLNGGAPSETIVEVGLARLAAGLSFNGLPLRKLGGFERDHDTSDPTRREGYSTMLNRWLGIVQEGGGGGGGSSQIADWNTSLVRFIFLDGDAGNDANAGFIDAPPGSTFTALQAAAVAVRTTHRINQIRPPVGAGRTVVVMFKPRAGGLGYDHIDGDGSLGMEDRSGCSGYKLMITRGSIDLSNSPTDWISLGSRTAIPGPNVDGSFTVFNVFNPTADHGLGLQLTGATLPDGRNLRKYRLRVLHGATTIYAPIQWGDIADIPDPTILYTSTLGAGTVSADDTLFIEEPGVRLDKFFEAADAADRSPFGSLRTYGIRIATSAAIGTVVAGPESEYNYVSAFDGSTITSRGQGDIAGNPLTFDESNNFIFGNQNPGLWLPGTSTSLSVGCGALTFFNSTFADTMAPGTGQTQLFGRSITLISTAVQDANVIASGGEGIVAQACLLGAVIYSAAARCQISSSRVVPVWGGPQLLQRYLTAGDDSIVGFKFDDFKAFWGTEPNAPGIVMQEGRMSLFVNRTNAAVSPGNGIRIETQVVNPGIDVPWTSLDKTGFDINGRQRVVVHLDGQGYPASLLPCPHCEIMRIVDAETSGTVFDVGLSVGTSLTVIGRIDLALASPGGVMPTGSLAAPCVQAGLDNPALGWAIVAMDDYLVVRAIDELGSGPVAGDLLFLSGTEPGKWTPVDPRPNGVCVILGRAVSIGPEGDLWYPCRWNPPNEALVPQIVADDISAGEMDLNFTFTDASTLATGLDAVAFVSAANAGSSGGASSAIVATAIPLTAYVGKTVNTVVASNTINWAAGSKPLDKPHSSFTFKIGGTPGASTTMVALDLVDTNTTSVSGVGYTIQSGDVLFVQFVLTG